MRFVVIALLLSGCATRGEVSCRVTVRADGDVSMQCCAKDIPSGLARPRKSDEVFEMDVLCSKL